MDEKQGIDMKKRNDKFPIAVVITILVSWMIVTTSTLRILLPDTITTMETVFYMNITSSLAFFVFCLIKKQKVHIHSPILVLLRSTLGLVGVFLFFLAYQMSLSLSAGIVIGQLAPIFAVFAMVILMRERIQKKHAIVLTLTLIGSFIGILIIANPFSDSSGENWMAVALSLTSSLLAGISMSVIRKLMEKDSPEQVGLFNALFSVVVLSIVLLVTQNFRVLEFRSYLLLFFMGVTNALVVFGMGLASHFASPTRTGPYSYSSVVFAPIMQLLVFGTVISINVVFGGILIVGVNIFNFLYHKKQHRKD